MNMSDDRKQKLECIAFVLQQSLNEDYKKQGWHNDPELNYRMLYKFNFVNWISMLLKGEDPHKSNLKKVLEKLKMNMMTFEQAYPSGNPYALNVIETMFNTIYIL